MIKYLLSILLVSANVLDEFVSKPEEVYGWFQEKNRTFTTLYGNTAYVLNVTSQTWMDESRAYGPRGAIWDHNVIVIVPRKLEQTNISTVWLTGNCNEDVNRDKILSKTDVDIIAMDALAHDTKTVTVVVKQVPNCKL
jgi:PhoPQ-activated pathogenicity-related protein